jgi:aryl-alcohol dehydrogenase-like predicted oxidoreductase
VTSSDYVISQDETSEAFIGEWAEKRGIREQLVIATKVLYPIPSASYLWMLKPDQYTTGFKRGQDQITHKINYAGNHAKSLRVSVDASLKKLRTPYIDILYLHWWDYGTSVEEVVDSLHTLVLQGKVLYLVRLDFVQLFTFFSRNFNDLVPPGHFR